MAPTAIVPFRWPGYGLDLRAYLDSSGPLFFADDVAVVLALDIPATLDHRTGRINREWPDGHTVFEGLDDTDGRPVVLYRAPVVLELAKSNPFAWTTDFIAWFEELVASLSGAQLVAETPSAHYAVAAAARLLSQDPALSFTRDSLFTALHDRLEWITRMNRVWIPTSSALRAGYVVREHVWVAGIKSTYPQVFITKPGLERLHAELGGTTTLDFDVDVDRPLTLVEPS